MSELKDETSVTEVIEDHVTEEHIAAVEDNTEVIDNQEPIEKQKMSGNVGNIGQFDLSSDGAHIQNGLSILSLTLIRTKLRLHFFCVMGKNPFNLLHGLVQPDRPGNKTYGDIVEILKGHFYPKTTSYC